MLLDASEQNQITVILILATILFIAASALPQKVAATAMMVLAPVQFIDTRFGSSSVVLAYVVFIALLLRRDSVRLPLLPQFLFLLLWYLVSMSQMPQSTYIQHAVYMFVLVSAILIFWLCYDLADRFDSPSGIGAVFVILNLLVVIYCAAQLWIGPGERLVFFGIHDMSMTRVRADGRLTGPFESAEITAQFFVIMEFIVIHQIRYTKTAWIRNALIIMAVLNLGFLVATGSRGEFLLLIGGGVMFLWLFRRRLGLARTIGLAVAGTIAITATALIVVNLTQFGGLFDRLERTEFNEHGIPDTRQYYWPATWQEIVKSPIVGHGPRYQFFNEHRGQRYPDHEYLPYPHNLYLYLLFTVGVPGLALYMLLLVTILFRCWRAMSVPNAPPYWSDFARIGVIVIVLYVVDGIKIDQMRLGLADYWHFFFGLCGAFVAAASQVDKASASLEQKFT
jgi:hypothetical protein